MNRDHDQDRRNDDAACGKLWEIYVKEAQQYDEGMIRSWKEDMDNMLVFCGLYSAILTAFVIESYQNLQPDLTEDLSILLRRISEQLASSSNLPPIPNPSTFVPTKAALACNILWFVSLALALTCALLATLVQQWSRRFLHRTSTVRSPGAHAHLLQFLYFGLKDFRMHSVVDLIPFLLHLSLFSFFAGLVGFLHDVNDILSWIATAGLSLVLPIYIALTVLPLFRLDSPYATPLSSLLWRPLQVWRNIHTHIPKPSISPLIRRLRSSNPSASHTQPADEEAQREPPDLGTFPSKDSYVQSLAAIEWNILDTTVKASGIRHVEHESKSIAWLLRSLNDDLELLPFVEALPDALQYAEDSDTFRETNLHLLDALLAPTDPQVNIILRILDLMDNSENAWHTKVHRERCALACARALYALGHVFQANPVRFRSTTNLTPLFTVEIIDRIGRGLCCGALEMAYGQSALVICALSSCIWLRSKLESELDNSSNSLSIIQQALTIGKIDWRWNAWYNLLVGETGTSNNTSGSIHTSPIQRQVIVDGAAGHLLYLYTLQAIKNYPQHFAYLSRLVISESAQSLTEYECCRIIMELQKVLDSGELNETDRDNVDAILKTAILILNDESISGTSEYHITECISSYHRVFGWGACSALANPDVRSKVLKCLQLRGNHPRPLRERYLTSLKHILPFSEDRDDYPFWSKVFQDIYRGSRNKSPDELSLAYLIALKASETDWMMGIRSEQPELTVLGQIYQNVSIERIYPSASQRHVHWIALLQSLGSHLPLSHISDVLKFFLSLALERYEIWEVSGNVGFLKLFTRYSDKYFSKLAYCLRSELEQLLEINAMIWAIWEKLARRVHFFGTQEECQAWQNVFSLLETIGGVLTPEMREASQAIVVQPHSSKNPSPAILYPRFEGDMDKRKFLDLPANIEATKKHFTRFMHLFTTLPEADAEEDRLLAMDDDTYSNHIYHDRIAAHYFVKLPPPDDEEDAVLQPPAGDLTYFHTEPASNGLYQGSDATPSQA